MKLTCKNCIKIWTKHCPIRVWGRQEENKLHLDNDVNPYKDFCSRIEIDFSLNINDITKQPLQELIKSIERPEVK